MNRSRRIAIILFALAFACTGAAFALGVGGSWLQVQANLFGESINLDPEAGQLYTDEQFRHMQLLWMRSQALIYLIAPAIIAALTAVFAALALMGWRWEAQRRARTQAEAPAVS